MIALRAVLILPLIMLWNAAPAAAQMFDAQEFKLANGLEVVAVANHRSPVVGTMIYYKVGSNDEVPGKTGLAHMVEHMMFKGTKTVSAGMFSRIVAANGGNDDAFTTYDYTAYYQNIAVDRLPEVLRLEADRMANLTLREKDFAPEHQVVLEELRMRVENSPEGKLNQQMDAALYLNAPYHHPVIGWRSEVEHLTLADVVAFQHRWYAPNNAVLVVSGDITAESLKPMVEQYFGPLRSRPLPARLRTEEPPPLAARSLILRDPNVHQPAWNRLYLAPSYTTGETKYAYPLQVLAEVLGADTSSRLYRSLVVEQKLASEVWAGYEPESLGMSSFDFYASPNPGVDLDKLASAVDDAIRAAIEKGASPDEVDRAKTKLRSQVIYARDSFQTGAFVFGTALANGRTVADVQAWPERIAAVTSEQVNEAARAVLRDQASVTGTLLPTRPGEAPSEGQGGEQPIPEMGRSLR
jgi:zinc protease